MAVVSRDRGTGPEREALLGRGDPASGPDPAALLRRLTWPVAGAVALAVAASWYVSWATSGFAMGVLMAPAAASPSALLVVLLLLGVMMVAMMLPSALPVVLTYHRLTSTGRERPGERLGTAAFAASYFVVWGLFALAAYLALSALGLLGPLTGSLALAPGAVLVAAGTWQVTRTKGACLAHCQSPMGFLLLHWREGRLGAWRMGVRHAAYCIGCCWLFMLVLFIGGAMSLAWMAGISVAILVEKVGWRPSLTPQAIGVVLVAAGLAVLV